MIAHVTSLEISKISIYLPSILVFVFNLIAVSFAFVLDTLFSFFFLPIIFLFANCTSHATKGNESNPSRYGSLEQPNLHPVCSEDGWEGLHRVLQRERVWNKPLNEFLHTTDLKDQPLVVSEGGGGKGGGKGRMKDSMEDLLGEWREDQSSSKKYKIGYYKKLTANFLPMRWWEGGGVGWRGRT